METMNLFQQLWQNWAHNPHSAQDFADEMPWINELNQAVFSRLERGLAQHVQLMPVKAPMVSVLLKDETGQVQDQTLRVSTYRLVVPEGEFEKRVELATMLLENLIARPGVRTAFIYSPIVPECVELHDGSPNRKYLKIRLQTTPNVAVDAHEGNT